MRRLGVLSFSSILFAITGVAKPNERVLPTDLHTNCTVSDSMAQNVQNHMFDGIELSETQRQQMRDLTNQFRFRHSEANLNDIQIMRKLTLSPDFNEAAVRQQAKKLADQQVNFHVDMAHARHQMYGLLTEQQQAQLQQNYVKRINTLCALAELP